MRLSVLVDIPGSWFGAGESGELSAGERKDKYTAQAVEFEQVHEFPRGKKKASKEPGIRFVCRSDATDDAEHSGFWMPLVQWNTR